MGKASASQETRVRLLNIALRVMRQKGYAATSVDDICKAAGVTKGSFFHHFESKEDLGLAAARHFSEMADTIFGPADFRKHEDPVDRLLGYVDLRIAMLRGETCDYTCLLGTFVQELYETHPPIREACDRFMSEHVAMLTKDVEEAKARYAPGASWSAESLGFHMQAVVQGSFIFAKAKQGPQVAAESLAHLRRYLDLLFRR